MELIRIVIAVLILVLVGCVITPTILQHGGWATSPAVFDQLYAKGDMDVYLTGS
jgi:hypothetical protein